MAEPRQNCYVYIITAGPFIKVGVAKNIDQRLNDLQVGCPLQYELVWTSDRNRRTFAEILENAIHAKLNMHRVRGEWFDANPIWAIKLAKETQFETIQRCDPNLSHEELDDLKFELKQETDPDPNIPNLHSV